MDVLLTAAQRWRVVLLVGVLCGIAAKTGAQEHLFVHRWRIDGAGIPTAVRRSMDLREAESLAPRLRFEIIPPSGVAWTTVSFVQTDGPGPLWPGGAAVATHGAPGCSSFADSSPCLDLGAADVGVYTIEANVSGFGSGSSVLVIGGGSRDAVSGPQSFAFSGVAEGVPFAWGLSLDDDQPATQSASFTPGLDPAGMAAALAAWVDALPGYSAISGGDTLYIDTQPAGRPFRFWLADFQATGGEGSFDGDAHDVTQHALPGDRQPGANFPIARAEFGTDRSENIDAGDADNDGDLDVVVANGGDGAGQVDRIFINRGGLQGGEQGTFTDETATRFPGMPAAKSRDIEFADIDGDFDLDVFCAIYGTVPVGGAVSRSFRNQGGVQGGSVGYFLEDTDVFWGTLVSVQLGDQILGGNQGPWRGFTCDCDFGDLDLDGDVDLFHAGYGPEISGNQPSRVFLNDGTGRFDELWPWADPAADIQTHTLDIDLVDLDGDFDLDIFNSSRDSQARVFRNDLDAAAMGWPGSPFTDVTQSALLDQGATQWGNTDYECEPGDVDGDGDFDVWMVNYASFQDRLLRNDGGLRFTSMPNWIRGDPDVDENEADFLDYDGDGDLDTFMANFSGVNALYLNGLADGLDYDTVGLMHRTGTTASGSLASWTETPASGNSSTTLDADAADMDGDGDADLLLANDGNAQNRYLENVLGIPDTHAPSIALLTVQGDKSDGNDTVIRAQLRDNAAHYVINQYPVDLVYTVDGGLPNRVAMTSQGGQSFQAVIPGGVNGTISYRVEGHDQGWNAFTSAPISYVQTSSGATTLLSVGEGTPGVFRRPRLALHGTLQGGTPIAATLRNASPASLAAWFFSSTTTPLPFKGGLLHTAPVLAVSFVTTNAGGHLHVASNWPTGLPSGLALDAVRCRRRHGPEGRNPLERCPRNNPLRDTRQHIGSAPVRRVVLGPAWIDRAPALETDARSPHPAPTCGLTAPPRLPDGRRDHQRAPTCPMGRPARRGDWPRPRRRGPRPAIG